MDLVVTLTGALVAALLFGFIAQRLHLSSIVGYLVAGIVVGPFTPGFVAHPELASQLAEVGVILLLFGVGLTFHIEELLAVRRVAIPGAVVGICAATALGTALGTLLGWSRASGIVFGISIGVASTVVLLRVLTDAETLHTRDGHLAIGWLIVEDLLSVLVLVLLPVFGREGSANIADAAGAVFLALLKIAALVAGTLAVGKRAIPAILGYVAKTRSRELFTLTVLVLALGIAVGSARLFGASMALGAFLAGIVVGQSDFSARAASEALPMRDAFAVLFFVSVGMLFDPARAIQHIGLVAATLAVVVAGKPLVVFGAVRLLGHPPGTALRIAAAVSQIGEFSFVLAALGRDLHLISEAATQAVVAVSILSVTLNPFLVRWTTPLARRLDLASRTSGARATTSCTPSAARVDHGVQPANPKYRAVVVGYGPVGRTLVRLLGQNGFYPTIVELNHDTVVELRKKGLDAIYGDASQIEILRRAGVETAKDLVFAASGSAETVIRAAKELNPEIRVLARTTYVREVDAARTAGAQVVVSAEVEVALAMTEHFLSELGATGEQLDRERDRVREELGGALVAARVDTNVGATTRPTGAQ